jgi:hypothetical protein
LNKLEIIHKKKPFQKLKIVPIISSKIFGSKAINNIPKKEKK